MIKYANPEYAWLFLLVPVVALMIWLTHRRKLRMMQLLVGNTSLHQHLFRGYSSALNRWRYFLLLAALFFLVIAMVNPQIGTRTEQIKRKGVDVIVALDVSASMATRDLVPSRLDKAKYQVQSFIDLLQGDRIGLIAFCRAGSSTMSAHCRLRCRPALFAANDNGNDAGAGNGYW
jgi:Ca-activated chloride channel family protein